VGARNELGEHLHHTHATQIKAVDEEPFAPQVKVTLLKHDRCDVSAQSHGHDLQ
jgi:hypothetical protein